MNAAANVCPECGNPISASRQPDKMFCSPVCRQQFNNHRIQRGGDLYDQFRALRRERDKAKSLNLWTQICRLELVWHMEDEEKRPGRKSCFEPARALANLLARALSRVAKFSRQRCAPAANASRRKRLHRRRTR